MKLGEIKRHLASVVPIYTDLFTKNINITSLTFDKTSGLVTAVCAGNHGLANGRTVTITDAKFRTPINNIICTHHNTAIARTSVPHDLTEGWQSTIEIQNTVNYNGIHPLVSVIDRCDFEFEIGKDVSGEGSGELLENRLGYNGAFGITVVNPTTFTYKPMYSDLSPSAEGNIYAKTAPRIACIDSTDELSDYINNQKIKDPMLFIMAEDVDANQDAELSYDVMSVNQNPTAFHQLLIENLSVMLVLPKDNSTSGAEASDICDDVRSVLCRCLCGYAPESVFRPETGYSLTFTGDSTSFSSRAFFVRDFSFQRMTELTASNVYSKDQTRAFRDVNLSFTDRDLSAIIALDK